MKKHLMLSCLAVCLIGQIATAQITSIHLVSEEWEKYTNSDGTGLYWDIFRAVYEPEGIAVTFELTPYMRATKMVQSQMADASVAVYLDEFEPALFPHWHFDHDVVSALFKKGAVAAWEREASLHGTLGWIRGYEYDQYLSAEHIFVEIDSRPGVFKMLEAGRLDFFLDAEDELADMLESALEQGAIQPDAFQVEIVLKLNLYLAFADNERGAELRAIFDRRMAELTASGALKAIFETWGDDYPFDE